MSTIFTKIINREIPGYIVAEDHQHLAFLDINPLVTGHTLVVPKKEIDYIYDLEDRELSDLHVFSKKVALAIQQAIPCVRVGVAVIGLEVPHCHIHLIPMQSMEDMDFTRPKLNPTPEQLSATASGIASHYL